MPDGDSVKSDVETEAEKFAGKMEDVLKQRIIGLTAAVEAVSDAIRRARSGLKGPQTTDRCLSLPRPTGVGKGQTST